MNSTVAATPTVKPGYRLMPATVSRTNDTSVTVYIECPTWCTEDHVDEPVRDIEDVMHRGAGADVYVPTFGYGAYPVQLHAWVESDPVATDPKFRAAHLVIGDVTGNDGSHITPEMADKLADDLIGLASEIRHMARTARLHNQTVGDSDPNMDEALRRVRADGWRSLSAEDIAALPIVRLLKAFGVMVVEYDIADVELLGEPGHMELRVGRATRQGLRDSEARRLIAEYAAGARRV